ncbi:type I polyketide synthase [Bradyrhizobium roseum]|uniref:type I polyketide synthase n=1 Tax=Bradyrhizobium roseum TaxID=3056648 RepID=UPI0026137112|nr:type I polyketide synthase [Bradyrhizobium roseus]WKA26400.1 SDR family NAD(P)-dependent oxidoreductase [Bradyrhizobium roseus]
MDDGRLAETTDETGIAIIGMAGRFPGAPNIDVLWKNLLGGIESIQVFSDEELKANGLSDDIIADPGYVKASPVLDGVALFDADYFNLSPKEVEYIDPQHRLFLECAVEVLENAGCNPQTFGGNIGVFGGAGPNSYQLLTLRERLKASGAVKALRMLERLESDLLFVLGGDKDYLATRVSYKLNLRGPSFTVQTACSTSLVAVHLACQSLHSGECDVALAGGVSITPSSYRRVGYGGYAGMTSPDGHCRPFDANANGTVFGDGVCMVALKRLDRAISDGDAIRAVIRGSAVNNDGSVKVGYTAPSIDGQAAVIAESMAMAGVSPETISYVEAHGTGTLIGDPIEIASLTKAFRGATAKKAFCGIGSLKSNIGHLNTAAGVAGLIKTVLSLENECVPPSINFTTPNEHINFPETPFYVVSRPTEWARGNRPRRAGVNSFGIGGTNVHLIVEEAPLMHRRPSHKTWHTIPLSARSPSALRALSENLAECLEKGDGIEVDDVAYTLGVGRVAHKHRRAVVCQDRAGAIKGLRADRGRPQDVGNGSLCFMFPGQGTQRLNMGRGLYAEEPVYRAEIDRCADILRRVLDLDLRDLMFVGADRGSAESRLASTQFAQPAIFSVSHALAQLWISRGVRPQGMLGHSVGEFVAACVAGVMTLEQALEVIATRGKLMQALPRGNMLFIPAAPDAFEAYLEEDVSIAALNGPSAFVVSGPEGAISRLNRTLREKGISPSELHTSHAFHSEMMAAAVEPFVEAMKQVDLRPPTVPFVSNVTGTWITPEEATDPHYWGRHLRQTVRFSEGVKTLLEKGPGCLLEVGPGRTLTTLARQNMAVNSGVTLVASLPNPDGTNGEVRSLNETLAELWGGGTSIDWQKCYQGEQRAKAPLPAYPFERQRYWLDSPDTSAKAGALTERSQDKNELFSVIDDAFLVPSWRYSAYRPAEALGADVSGRNYLVFSAADALSSRLIEGLRARGANVVVVELADEFAKANDRQYFLQPSNSRHFELLLSDLKNASEVPTTIIYLWSLLPSAMAMDVSETTLNRTFYGLMYLAQALGKELAGAPIKLAAVVADTQDVLGDEPIAPIAATARGPCLVIPREYPSISCHYIDISRGEMERRAGFISERLIDDLASNIGSVVLAYRTNRLWIATNEPIKLSAVDTGISPIRENGVYLITGGLGDISLAVAQALADCAKVNLVLCGRSSIPDRASWDSLLADDASDIRLRNIVLRIREIEAKGSSVSIGVADVSDVEAMRGIVEKARRDHGRLHGVIHAAGVVNVEIIATQNPSKILPVFSPKISGTVVLDRVLQDDKLDFLVFFSSLSAVVGGVGVMDYVSANAYIDAFTLSGASRYAEKTIAIGWDIWSEIGMATRGVSETLKSANITEGLLTREGTEAFLGILRTNLRQVLVSKKISQRYPGFVSGNVSASTTGTVAHNQDRAESDLSSSNRYPRPEVTAAYVAPGTEIERIVADLWGAALNVEAVGVNDDFFELGGDSLLALQMIPRIQDRFQIGLVPRELFEGATVAGVARVIETKLIEEVEELEKA